MKLIVSPHKIEIEKSPINEKEIDITKVEFKFNNIPENYVKDAFFTYNGTSYKVLIENNECSIPYEVLNKQGQVEIGVVAYLVENETEIKRYNPSPVYISTLVGSLKEQYENTEPITPSDKEQIEQELLNISTQMDNLDIDAEKEEHKTTITITKKDGTTKEVEVLDGEKGDKGDKGEPGAIKMIIVNELPQTGQEDTIYLVPLAIPESQENRYAEYVYINDTWELLGKIGIQVDLTDYYTKTETNNLLDNKADVSDIPDLTNYVQNTDYATNQTGGVFRINTNYGININPSNGNIFARSLDYAIYSSGENVMFISKGTLENVIAGKDLTTKAYVDGLVGDINTALDTINGEVI